jgi:hypothetical protein
LGSPLALQVTAYAYRALTFYIEPIHLLPFSMNNQ